MIKKHFIALADFLKSEIPEQAITFDDLCLRLADFCRSQNPRFDRARWLAYVAGECGPNGGKK